MNRKLKKASGVALAIGLSGLMTACSTAASSTGNTTSNSAGGGGNSSSGTVTVASITSMTSSIADLGVPAYNAEKLAVDQINSNGGLLGKKIKLVKFDDAAQPNVGAQDAQTAILNDNAQAIFGPVSSAVAAAIEPIANKNKRLVFFHTSNDISLTTTGFTPYEFQVTPNTDMESTAVAMLFKQKGWTRIATISPNYSYGRDTINNFLKMLKKLGVHYTLVNQQWPQLGTTDYSSYLSTLLADKPQAVFSPLFGGDLVSFSKQGTQFGLFQKTNFVSMMDSTVLQSLGSQAPLGAWGYSRVESFTAPSSQMTQFVQAYKQAYGSYPTDFAILAYSAVQTWEYGVKQANSFDPTKVETALGGATVPTVRGDIKIDTSTHQAEVGEWVGQVAKNSNYPFATWNHITYFTPSQIMN